MMIWQMKDPSYHEPVLVEEVLRELALLKDKKIIDATLGTGGHSLAMLSAGAEVLGIEADQEILAIAKERLKGLRITLVQGNFNQIGEIARANGFDPVDGVIFDLGVSNLQLTNLKRGFSFASPEVKLDMRLDPEKQGVSGADLLNSLRKDQLETLFGRILDFSSSRWLTKRVIAKRSLGPILTVGDFLKICRGLRSKPGLNPATLPFLAVRVAVNSELENLKEALHQAFDLLRPGGKLLVIAFHSGERRITENFSREFKGPIRPSREEIGKHPRSRSAELFVLEKEKNEKN